MRHLRLYAFCFGLLFGCVAGRVAYDAFSDRGLLDVQALRDDADAGFCEVYVPANEFPISVYLDASSAVLEEHLLAAMSFWNEAGAGPVFAYGGRVVFGDLPSDPMELVELSSALRTEEGGHTHLSWSRPVARHRCPIRRAISQIRADLPEQYLMPACAHELGHRLGFSDDLMQRSVMFWRATPFVGIVTLSDLGLLRQMTGRLQ